MSIPLPKIGSINHTLYRGQPQQDGVLLCRRSLSRFKHRSQSREASSRRMNETAVVGIGTATLISAMMLIFWQLRNAFVTCVLQAQGLKRAGLTSRLLSDSENLELCPFLGVQSNSQEDELRSYVDDPPCHKDEPHSHGDDPPPSDEQTFSNEDEPPPYEDNGFMGEQGVTPHEHAATSYADVPPPYMELPPAYTDEPPPAYNDIRPLPPPLSLFSLERLYRAGRRAYFRRRRWALCGNVTATVSVVLVLAAIAACTTIFWSEWNEELKPLNSQLMSLAARLKPALKWLESTSTSAEGQSGSLGFRVMSVWLSPPVTWLRSQLAFLQPRSVKETQALGEILFTSVAVRGNKWTAGVGFYVRVRATPVPLGNCKAEHGICLFPGLSTGDGQSTCGKERVVFVEAASDGGLGRRLEATM